MIKEKQEISYSPDVGQAFRDGAEPVYTGIR